MFGLNRDEFNPAPTGKGMKLGVAHAACTDRVKLDLT